MLKAVEGMIDAEPKDTLAIRTGCARKIVSELISNLEAGSQPLKKRLQIDAKSSEETLPEPSQEEPEELVDKYQVVVDKDMKLTGIKGLPLEAIITVDGKKVKHQDAIGKTFTTIKLPD
jgi:hypothetical protein